jgi:hypothetical protein
MNPTKYKHCSIIFILIVILTISASDLLYGQYDIKWMTVGSFQSPYSSGGAMREHEVGEGSEALISIYPAMGYHTGNMTSQALWVGAKDFTDKDGVHFDYKMSTLGPRATGGITVYPISIKVVGRFKNPTVWVDGAQTYERYTFVDSIDKNMKADRMIITINNNNLGITMERRVYAFSQEFHDNYHINEYIFTNTGNIDADPEIELHETLHDVYFYFISRYCMSWGAAVTTGGCQSWGKFTMNDAVGDGFDSKDDVGFTAQYSWAGYDPNISTNIIGLPLLLESYLYTSTPDIVDGRLEGAQMIGHAYIHADHSAVDETNDTMQPATMNVVDSDDADLITDEYNNYLMRRQYENFCAAGRLFPHHADVIVPSGDFANQDAPANTFKGVTTAGGFGFSEGFGPYTLAPGEDVRLVIVEGVGGLNYDAKIAIGKAYKESGANDELLIEYNGKSMTKNEWIMTTKDSLFLTFKRAIANYESGYNIPKPPLPPSEFYVNSSADEIKLSWDVFPESEQTGFEIYRAAAYYNAEDRYELIASLGPDERSYEDSTALRGIDYYYYIVAVGDINFDSTGMTPTGVRLKSNREYSRTFSPARLKRQAGDLSKIHIVPNPYNIASDPNLRYPDQQDKLGFLDIPGICTIKIFTQLGNLIETIEHTDGSGDEFWDLTTYSKQVVSSGLYIAVIQDKEADKVSIKKFVVIR